MAELEKTLSYPTILIITINSIMGTGIFFLPAVGAQAAGPASVLAWIAMAIVAMAVSLIFAELVSMYPTAGGIYEYTKQAFGPFISFVVGWMAMVVGNITIAMLVVGAVQYLSPELSQLFKILISIAFILMFNYMAYRGMQTSAVMLVAFGIVTLTTIFGLMIPGLINLDPGHFTPFFVTDISLVFLAIFIIAETFFGWETATFLAEETKDATKVMPRALWVATLIIGIICVLFVIASLGTIEPAIFGESLAPLSDLGLVLYGEGMATVIAIMVYLSIIGSVAGWIVSAPRLLMTLAQDKLFIPQLAQIHPEYKTPHKSILFQTILTSILVIVGAGSYTTLLHLLVPIVLGLYSVVILSFIVMRFTKKDVNRPFKVWQGVPIGIGVILFLLSLVTAWLFLDPQAIHTLQLAIGFGLIGIPLFLLLTVYYNPTAIAYFTESTARINYFLERIILPHKIREEIRSILPELQGKKVLDYGAGIGTMTHHLLPHIGEEGHIIATDMSKKSLKILDKRLKKQERLNFTIIHDPRHINRIHPETPFVDVVVSVGTMSYAQDFKRVLDDINRLLPEEGTICFVDYIDYFWLLPNAGWLHDEKKLLELFQEAGFRIEIVKIKGLFWKYLVIYGKKISHDQPYI